MDAVFLPFPQSQEPIPIIRDEELLDSQPKFPSPPPSTSLDVPTPLINPSLEKILTDLTPKEQLERYHQDLAADGYLYGPTIDRETRVTEHGNPVSLPSLENIDDDSQKKRKVKRRWSKESARNVNKKLKIPVSLPSLENIDDDSQKKRKVKRRWSKESARNVNKKLKIPVSLPSLENIDDDSQKKRKVKRRWSKESARNVNKKLKIPVSLPSLENIDDDSQKKRKVKRRWSKESARNVNKKLKIPVSLP